MSLSIDTIMDCIDKPYKLQIIQVVQDRKECTVSELQKIITDVPQATMYRMLDDLVKKGILQICREIQVRAVLKKVYAVSSEWIDFQNSIVTENNADAYSKAFAAFALRLVGEFRDYAKRDDINIAKDGSGFNAVNIYASDEELMDIGIKINEIIKNYQTKNGQDGVNRKMHTFATILTPPRKEGD